jgi:hypothetical protein
MGHYVHLNVCFACDTNDAVAKLAKKHMPPEDGNREARWFLMELAARTGTNPGPKGGLATWGIVGNHTNEDEFVETLLPFWKALLAGVDGGPNSFEHILVFVEHEGTERPTAIEIYLEDDENQESLTIKKHLCPFTWKQM